MNNIFALKNYIFLGISISLVNKYVFSILFYYNISGYLAGQGIGFNFWVSIIVLFVSSSLIFFFLDMIFKNAFFYQYLISVILCFLSFHIFLDISNLPEWRHLRAELFGLTTEKYLILLWYLLPVLFFSLTNILLKNKIEKINKFFIILSLCFFFIFLYRVLLTPAPSINYEYTKINKSYIHKKKVIWILFDEFDYKFYSKINNLYNFKKFRSNSLELTNMHATSNATITAIPEILTGIRSKGYVTTKNFAELYLVDEKGNKKKFNFENSIFGKINNKGFNSSIFGIYHPYCHIFFQVSKCSNIEYHHEKIQWYDGIKNVLFLNLIDKFLDFRLGLNSDLTKKQIDLIPFHIQSDENLVFMHFGFPHLPSLYAQKYFNKKAYSNDEKYNLNLQLADEVLGYILELLDKRMDHDLLIILSSDHGLRGFDEQRAVLFNAKIKGDDTSITINKNLSNYYINELVLDYFDNKINTNREIEQFFENKKSIPTRKQNRFSM